MKTLALALLVSACGPQLCEESAATIRTTDESCIDCVRLSDGHECSAGARATVVHHPNGRQATVVCSCPRQEPQP